MNYKDLADEDWFIKKTDTVDVISEKIKDTSVAYIPVINKKHLLGYAPIDDLRSNKHHLDDIELAPPIALDKQDHIFHVIGRFRESRTDVLAILNSDMKFKGSVLLSDMLKYFADFAAPGVEGSIVVLKSYPRDYELSKIVRLAESHNVKVLNIVTESSPKGYYLIHMVLSTHLSQDFINSLQRHDFMIDSLHNVQDDRRDIEDNYKMLMKFLDI